MKVLYVKAT